MSFSPPMWMVEDLKDPERGFKALKIWFNVNAFGIKKYSRLIEQNMYQAQFLKFLIENEEDLELLAPVSMNIVCFRYKPKNIDENNILNEINKEILLQLHERGNVAPSYTTINEKYAIRVAITNHRSENKDFEKLRKEVLEIGKKLEK